MIRRSFLSVLALLGATRAHARPPVGPVAPSVPKASAWPLKLPPFEYPKGQRWEFGYAHAVHCDLACVEDWKAKGWTYFNTEVRSRWDDHGIVVLMRLYFKRLTDSPTPLPVRTKP